MKKTGGKKSIGVFDSGFGGLHILRGIVKELPEYDFVYLGDTARNPYGTRSKEVVYGFTKQGVDFLFEQGSELVVLACNTASAEALRKIQMEYLPKKYPGKRVIGVVIPAVEAVIGSTRSGRVGVIATEGTIHSKAFAHEILKKSPKLKIFSKACPLLVPLIEEGEHDLPHADLILKTYLNPVLKNNIDTLVLGCTHYGIVEDKIQKIAGKKVKIISEAKIVPKKLREYLGRHPEIENKLSKKGKRTFYSTDLTEKFQKLGSKFFGKKINVQKAQLS